MPDISLPGPEKIPRGLAEGYIPKYRHLLRQYELLDDIWNVQLSDEEERTYGNIRVANSFWREHLPDTFEGRRFVWTKTWIVDAMQKTVVEINRMRKIARMARAKDRTEAGLDETGLGKPKHTPKRRYEDQEKTLEKSKVAPGDGSDSTFDSDFEFRRNLPAMGPSCQLPLRIVETHEEHAGVEITMATIRQDPGLQTHRRNDMMGDGNTGARISDDETMDDTTLLCGIEEFAERVDDENDNTRLRN